MWGQLQSEQKLRTKAQTSCLNETPNKESKDQRAEIFTALEQDIAGLSTTLVLDDSNLLMNSVGNDIKQHQDPNPWWF